MKLPADSQTIAGHALTWYGHSTFVLRTSKGVRMMFDPFLTGNPSCPESLKKVPALDAILISHGHSDHTGDAVLAAKTSGAAVFACYEVAEWIEQHGAKEVRPMNIGGSDEFKGIRITQVQALHSSSLEESGGRRYMGVATGFIVRLEDGLTIYFAGDTGLFGDMKIFRERYAPSVAFLPIGDRFTMGPEDAALAGEWLGVKTIVPMHWGTFGALTGTPDALKKYCGPRNIKVMDIAPGETKELK